LLGCNSEKEGGICLAKIDTLDIDIGNTGLNNYTTLANDVFVAYDSVFFVCYNYLNHSLDYFNISARRFLHQIALHSAGPDAIPNLYYLRHYNSKLYAIGSPFFLITTLDGKVLQKLSTSSWFEDENVKYCMATNQLIANYDTGFAIDSVNRKIILPIYPLMKKENFGYFKTKSLGYISFDSLSPNALETQYPPYLQKADRYGQMDRPQVFVNGDSILFSFASHPDIQIYISSRRIQKSISLVSDRLPLIKPMEAGNRK
jgi:hypothetical protein